MLGGQCVTMLERVHMPDPSDVMRRYPHQISGGQQQRVVIAMAMINNPALLIMDEPTTALDVTVEAAVLDLLEELKHDFQTANIFITHNLGVVARITDYLCVMYAGELVERGPIEQIFDRPCHPYTMGLLACIPQLGDSKKEAVLHPIRGRVPAPTDRPEQACIFAPRCDHATDACLAQRPTMVDIGQGHMARCIYAGDLRFQSHRRRKIQVPDNNDATIETKSDTDRLLDINDIKIYYPQQTDTFTSLIGLKEKSFVKAVDSVSARLNKGRTLGVVGESGCGKSTLVKGIIGLEPVTGGTAQFMGVDISRTINHRPVDLIREMQMVFQNPDATLNPSYPVGKQIARPIRKFKTVPRHQIKGEVLRLLKAVRLGSAYYDRLPRQLSGGEKTARGHCQGPGQPAGVDHLR